jgi:glycosyltransferase involved in cell wall biosynthesis
MPAGLNIKRKAIRFLSFKTVGKEIFTNEVRSLAKSTKALSPVKSTTPASKVCMFVYNNLVHDSRVKREAESLTEAGYQVTVIGLMEGRVPACEDRNRVRILRVKGQPWYHHVLTKLKVRERGEEDRLNGSVAWKGTKVSEEMTGGKKFYARMTKRVTFFEKLIKPYLRSLHRQLCYLSFYLDAYRHTGSHNCDMYHAHDLNTLPVAYLAARRNKAKFVYDSHELYLERNKPQPSSRLWKVVLSRLEAFLARRADAVLTVNETLGEVLALRYSIPRPFVLLNTPAGFERIALLGKRNGILRDELKIPPDAKVLIYVGSIKSNRGLEEVIQALKYLKGCCLVCMGYGDDRYKRILLELADNIGVSDRFFFFGPVPTSQVVPFAAGADLGVAPIANACMSYYYCSPNKLFEYMNAGLPVIASAFPELEKIVLSHEVGLTFDPSDPEDIARAARRILYNPEKGERMRKNAVRASQLYNWENESRKLVQIYESLKSHPASGKEIEK